MTDPAEDGPALVVIVNNRADWRRVVEEGWYRIPVKRAPHPVAAWFLAFYHTRAFGRDAHHIRFVARARRYRLVHRRDLIPEQPDHPRASERYYRVDLGPLEELAYPIPSRRLRRITFIPTTLRRLREADEINDLWLGDDVEDLLWDLFRDAGIKAERRLEIGEARAPYGRPKQHPHRVAMWVSQASKLAFAASSPLASKPCAVGQAKRVPARTAT